MTALLVILILVFLIVVHELGHFIVAKIFGIRVDEFGLGYPPRAFTFGKIGETEYTLNWIPFGGFVRLFGEDEDSHGKGSFADSKRWKQALVLVAGVAMNAIAAWGLFTGAYAAGILHPVDAPGMNSKLVVTDVVPGSPADEIGIHAGDLITDITDPAGTRAIDGNTPDSVVAFVGSHVGREVDITYERNGASSTVALYPAHAVIAGDANRPAIGVGLTLVTAQSEGLKDAMIDGFYQTIGVFRVVAKGLWTILSGALHGAPDLSDVVGPVGLVSAVGEAAQNGLGYVLSLAGFISVNLVIVNLIPIPALDGGRLLIVIIEAILRRPAPKLALQTLNALGIALIIILMLTVTYHDIVRLAA